MVVALAVCCVYYCTYTDLTLFILLLLVFVCLRKLVLVRRFCSRTNLCFAFGERCFERTCFFTFNVVHTMFLAQLHLVIPNTLLSITLVIH